MALQIAKVIGEGSFGVCFRVLDVRTNQVFALKRVPRASILQPTEVALLQRIRHPNIVSLHAAYCSVNKEKCVETLFGKSNESDDPGATGALGCPGKEFEKVSSGTSRQLAEGPVPEAGRASSGTPPETTPQGRVDGPASHQAEFHRHVADHPDPGAPTRISQPHLVFHVNMLMPHFTCDLGRYLGMCRATSRPANPLVLLRVFSGVAKAVAHLHGLGVIHRDIKPSNILLRISPWQPTLPTGAEPPAKREGGGQAFLVEAALSDFGSARQKNARYDYAYSTPANYRSPEQWLGIRHTSSSDIFAFGMTVLASLQLRPPIHTVTNVFQVCPPLPPQAYNELLDRVPEGLRQDAAAFLDVLRPLQGGGYKDFRYSIESASELRFADCALRKAARGLAQAALECLLWEGQRCRAKDLVLNLTRLEDQLVPRERGLELYA